MRLGLLLPQGYFNEFDGWNPHAAYGRVLEIALEAERRGFDSVWLGEHVLAKWNSAEIAFDCLALATAIAAEVPRVEIGFAVVNSTFRPPAMTAKAAGTMDAVSGGRLVLGLGAGFKVSEATAFGHAFPDLPTRMAILAEHFEIITRMLDNEAEPFSYEGRYANVADMDASPRSVGRRRMPIMAAGRGKEVTFRLAAKYADILNLGMQLEEVPDHLPWIQQRCEEIGRDPATLQLQAAINSSVKYRGLTNFGGQRMMEPHEFGFTDPKYLLNIASRAAGFITEHFGGKLSKETVNTELLDETRKSAEAIAESYEDRDYAEAVRLIMALADKANAFVDDRKPWLLAKDPAQKEHLQQVCTTSLNLFRLLTIYLKPILPKIAEDVESFLNISPLTWKDAETLLTGTSIKPYRHLATRIAPTCGGPS